MHCKRFALAIVLTIFSINAFSKEDGSWSSFFSNPGPKPERNYFSFGISLNEFNKMSVDLVLSEPPNSTVLGFSGLTAQTYGASFIFGNYIDDTFKTEFRYGRGIKDDTLEQSLDVKLDHWVSMLLGADQDITDYMRGYALFGLTYYQADVTRRETIQVVEVDGINTREPVQPATEGVPRNLFETDFSITWLLGLDYKLNDQWYLSFEYGRLIKDTDSNIELDQYSTYLKFEF